MVAVVFDLDGTLVDTVTPHTFIWQKVLAEQGIEVAANRVAFWIGAGSRKLAYAMARRAGMELTAERLDAMRAKHQRLMGEWANPPITLPGARELLRMLSERGIRWGIATSGRHPAVGHALKALGAPDETPLITFHDVQRNKPHPECLLKCAEKMGVDPKGCWMVGDAVWDILAARRAGMRPFGIRTGGASLARLKRAGAECVFSDPKELLLRFDEFVRS